MYCFNTYWFIDFFFQCRQREELRKSLQLQKNRFFSHNFFFVPSCTLYKEKLDPLEKKKLLESKTHPHTTTKKKDPTCLLLLIFFYFICLQILFLQSFSPNKKNLFRLLTCFLCVCVLCMLLNKNSSIHFFVYFGPFPPVVYNKKEMDSIRKSTSRSLTLLSCM